MKPNPDSGGSFNKGRTFAPADESEIPALLAGA